MRQPLPCVTADWTAYGGAASVWDGKRVAQQARDEKLLLRLDVKMHTGRPAGAAVVVRHVAGRGGGRIGGGAVGGRRRRGLRESGAVRGEAAGRAHRGRCTAAEGLSPDVRDRGGLRAQDMMEWVSGVRVHRCHCVRSGREAIGVA